MFHTIFKKELNRTTNESIILYSRRTIGFLLYLGIQVLGWIVILYCTARNASLTQKLNELYPAIASFSRAMVPALVSVINAILPALLAMITSFEQWSDEGVILKLTVSRLFLARMFNVLIQLFSFLLLLDPLLLASNEFYIPFVGQTLTSDVLQFRMWVRIDFEPDSSFACPAHQTAEGLFILIITELFLGKLIVLGSSVASVLVQKARRKPMKRNEFSVGKTLVGFYYFEALLLVCVPLAPFTAVLAPAMLLLNFKFEYYHLYYFQSKPKKPWAAKDAELFFVKIFLATAVCGFAFNHMFLQSTNYPKDCAMQDGGIGLCLPNSFNASTDLCTVDVDAVFDSTQDALLQYWSLENTDEYACLNAYSVIGPSYPKCLCQHKCGPFSRYTNGFTPLLDWLEHKFFSRPFLPLFSSGALLMFALALFFLSLLMCRSNSVHVLVARFSCCCQTFLVQLLSSASSPHILFCVLPIIALGKRQISCVP
jgi:hypothetical protein